MKQYRVEMLGISLVHILMLFAICDCKLLVFWRDNCTGQNKNWTPYTGLVSEANQPGILETMTIKYFEKSHTFTAADAFHAQIERGMWAKNMSLCENQGKCLK